MASIVNVFFQDGKIWSVRNSITKRYRAGFAFDESISWKQFILALSLKGFSANDFSLGDKVSISNTQDGEVETIPKDIYNKLGEERVKKLYQSRWGILPGHDVQIQVVTSDFTKLAVDNLHGFPPAGRGFGPNVFFLTEDAFNRILKEAPDLLTRGDH